MLFVTGILGVTLIGIGAAQEQQPSSAPAPTRAGPPSVSVEYRESASQNPQAGRPEAIAEGRRLFTQFNCIGCHAPGGGGAMGPNLLGGERIYGGAPATIFTTILQGRPHGMPAFGSILTPDQIWKLVAYVQSLPPRSGAAAETAQRGATR
jgi:cytochrome c oxidase cbb3-type subunit 3